MNPVENFVLEAASKVVVAVFPTDDFHIFMQYNLIFIFVLFYIQPVFCALSVVSVSLLLV